MEKSYVVYWIRLNEHVDKNTEGYIGITYQFEKRWEQHNRAVREGSNLHVHNAIRKYGDLIIHEVIHECTYEEAIQLEFQYRPQNNIGWNMATGGACALTSRKQPVKLYHISNPTEIHVFESYTDASRELDMSIGRITQAVIRNNPHYGLDGWAVLHDETFDTTKTLTMSEVASKRSEGLVRDKPSHFKGLTDRWSEEDKQRISQQHKGKKLSKEHIEILRDKNRVSPNLCKQVTLVHKSNPDAEYTYHSISEASRQLDLPLSRLKSKAQRPLNVFGKDGWAITKLGSE